MKKILIVIGTRPEAIKMAPLLKAFLQHKDQFKTRLCVTAQHREMLDQVLDFFDILPEYDLNLMTSGQNLSQLTADILINMRPILEDFNPDYVFVHGDTTTSATAALSAFYHGAKICHVEAGLRTYNKQSPFPEEINRQITARLADFHFAPTQPAKDNLMREGINEASIYVTGNTVIDALLFAKAKVEDIDDQQIAMLKTILQPGKAVILVTGHRRENIGDGFERVCQALKVIVQNLTVQIIYPVHLNPSVASQAHRELGEVADIHLIPPLAYPAFVWLMNKAQVIITDSGGIQEEAPSLGKHVLLTRETTERPEAITAGIVTLVGTDVQKIISLVSLLIDDRQQHVKTAIQNPYGNGDASQLIIKAMLNIIQ
jgi:UDP-N-acetylglucosamine 2-epimerase (non-hydrolysing)